MTWRQKPVGADLLRLFGPWLDGVELAAGQCLLAPEPAPTQLIGQGCGVDGCLSIICGATQEKLAEHLTNHRRRCHA